jgi:hypothetical protein
VLNLAAATEAPMVTLLTITTIEMNTFWRHGVPNWHVKAIMPGLPCIGCSARLKEVVTYHGCERGDFACVDAFDPSIVTDAVLQMAEGAAS